MFRDEVHDQGIEIVTVGMDAAGAEACRPFIEAATPQHPSLIDTHHRMAEQFGVINIPNAVWIDEEGTIVRPAEPAPAPPSVHYDRPNPLGELTDIPDRMMAIAGEAMQIEVSPAEYEAALRDWIAKGAESDFALSPEQVIERSRPRNAATSRGQAHFELAAHLEQLGHHDAAIGHFREAHRLVPDNFAYKRQAWSLEPGADGALARFWQGPEEGNEEAWPYDGDWLTDVRAMGPSNYYPKWETNRQRMIRACLSIPGSTSRWRFRFCGTHHLARHRR